jgi:3'-phosphoadenosine 5'-phosphosulfate sulfotransferase (PAPS reductase)/FAD synthetase
MKILSPGSIQRREVVTLRNTTAKLTRSAAAKGPPRVIVAISGGKASAWCADWALRNYPKEDVILYFNDTKWEHRDLYRFLDDLSKHFGHPITSDSDGRNPETLFYDNRALANNRVPFCSRILKAERLQKFYKDGDTLVFGIGKDEPHRASRLVGVYHEVAAKTEKWPKIRFPLIGEKVTKKQIDGFLEEANIKEPLLYRLGFLHNNCSGGCVRAGKGHWKLLYEKLPEVYADRERVEREMRDHLGKDVHFLRGETLQAFRGRIERGELSSYYEAEGEKETECIGVCSSMA